MRNADVAIVGGGIAGLIAAVSLARRGLRTCLFEAAPALGGRAQTRVMDGFRFNQGPHALYVAGALSAALAELGVPTPGGRLDLAKALAVWGEETHPWPSRRAAVDAAPPLNPAETRCLAETFAMIAEGGYGQNGRPLRAFTEGLPAPVRRVIEALVRVSSYSHAPEDIDAKAALDQLRLAFGGVTYLDGGWRTLVAGLASAATAAGATLRPEQPVVACRRQGAAWRVECAAGSAETFDAVILAVPPATARDLMAESVQVAAAAGAARSLRLVGLDLGLRSVPSSTAFALGMDRPVYLSLHSAIAGLTPAGGGLLHLARYLALDEAPQAAHIAQLEALADRLQPGWRECVVHKQRLVGVTVAHDLPHWRREGRRAAVVVRDAAGVFLAGDWVGEEGMLSDASAASAAVAAREAAAYLAGRAGLASAPGLPGQADRPAQGASRRGLSPSQALSRL